MDYIPVQLNYLQRGEGSPVILIHGLFGSAANLGMVARGLAPYFCVYSLDIRNHGQSPHCDSMTYPEMAADLAQFMDEHDIEQCPVMGHSMGGKIAMQLAMDNPDRVSRLAVADVAPVKYPPHHQETLAGLEAVASTQPASRKEADATLAQHVEDAGVRAFLLKSLQRGEDGIYRWQLNFPAIAANYVHLGDASVGEPYRGPTLFIKGGNSDYIQSAHQDIVRQLFPAAALKVIADTGHWLHAEKPALFNQVLLRFLRPESD